MGWFSSFCRGVSSFVSSAVSTVSRAVSSVKETASKAVSWMAEKAESFIGGVKNIWDKVKPIISTVISPALKIAAKWAGVALPSFPWISTAIAAFDKALEALVAWDKTGLAKKVSDAINWAIEKAKQLNSIKLNKEELKEAETHNEALSEARGQLRGEAARALDLATLITTYAQLITRISDVLENNNITDFEHYLRLRAAQKLLNDTESRLKNASNIEDINEDDIFLVEIGSELLKANPNVSDTQAANLDRIILERFNKKLIPFVFEEMIMAWGYNLETMEKEWKSINDSLAKEQVALRRLEVSSKLSQLTNEEAKTLAELQQKLPPQKAKMEQLRKRTNEMRNYVFAAEGFLQVLEKTPEQFTGKEYLLDDSNTAGMIIIDCAQHGKKWEQLTEDEQSLIIDFANIFEEASRARAAKLVEIAA